MSVPAIRWALRQTHLETPERFVLVVLADRADPSARCWPGVQDVAMRTGYSPRRVTLALSRLEDAGLIESRKRRARNGRQTSSLFTLRLDRGVDACGYDGGQAVDNPTGGVQAVQSDDPAPLPGNQPVTGGQTAPRASLEPNTNHHSVDRSIPSLAGKAVEKESPSTATGTSSAPSGAQWVRQSVNDDLARLRAIRERLGLWPRRCT